MAMIQASDVNSNEVNTARNLFLYVTVSIVRVHMCLSCEILFMLFCLIKLDLMRTSIKEDAHQGYDTLTERKC
jgi:hypothetical protein